MDFKYLFTASILFLAAILVLPSLAIAKKNQEIWLELSVKENMHIRLESGILKVSTNEPIQTTIRKEGDTFVIFANP